MGSTAPPPLTDEIKRFIDDKLRDLYSLKWAKNVKGAPIHFTEYINYLNKTEYRDDNKEFNAKGYADIFLKNKLLAYDNNKWIWSLPVNSDEFFTFTKAVTTEYLDGKITNGVMTYPLNLDDLPDITTDQPQSGGVLSKSKRKSKNKKSKSKKSKRKSKNH